MNGKPLSKKERDLIRRYYADTPTKDLARMVGRSVPSIYNAAFALGLKKSQEYLNSPAACRLRRAGKDGEQVGKRYQFPKGHVPANKGLRRPGWAPGRMRETQFKKGEMAGAAQKKWRPVGTIHPDAEGYLRMKVGDSNERPGRFNWIYVHTFVWERAHGPIPRGYKIKFIDGDRSNCALENLCLCSHADLMKQNTLHNYPKDIAYVIQLRGAVIRKINRRLRNEKQDRRSA